jgi:eukaryotic-like serine/threonine-protein kinase
MPVPWRMVVTDDDELIAGRYRLVSQVGSGAMGVVWQAQDELLGRTVAVKRLLLPVGMSEGQADEATRRAMREGRIAARLHHPHAITVYDVVEHAGRPCLIMEYLRAESLSAVLAGRGPLPPEDVARIGSQVAGALAAAHEAGIVHRDIKPGNVLLAEDGTAKITDFGISRAVGDATVTATGILAGTPAYLAPEVAQGRDSGFPADVFALGATLYAVVEGEPPFGLDDNPIALIYRITTSEVTPPRQAGPLVPVLTWMLTRNPSQRPTMQQAHEALTAVADDRPPPVRVPPVAVAPSPALDSPAAAGPSAGPPPSAVTAGLPAEGGNRRPRRSVVAAVVAAVSLLAASVLTAVLVADGTDTAGSGPITTTQDPTPNQAPSQPPATSANPVQPTPAPSPPPTTVPGPPPGVAVPQDTPEQLRGAIVDYYSLMPGNLDVGWTRMTADYQRNHAGGFAGYQSFWDAIQRVEVSDVSVTGPATVNATLVYFYKNGRVIEERTGFGLVAEDGSWKIARSAVLSSRAR